MCFSGCLRTTPISTAMSLLPNSSPSSALDDEFSASLEQQLRPLGTKLADIQIAMFNSEILQAAIYCVQHGWPQKHTVHSNIMLFIWPNIWPYFCIRSELMYLMVCCYGMAVLFCWKFYGLKSWPTWGTQALHRC